MLNVPEYIASAYQPFSAFDSVSISSGNSSKTSGIIENFNGGPLKRDKNGIPYSQSVNGVVKYTATITKDPITDTYNNEQRGWNGEAVLSGNDMLERRFLTNIYK
jgi:hypothetical protein